MSTKTGPPQLRTLKINYGATPAEKDVINRNAAYHGMTTAAYLRKEALSSSVPIDWAATLPDQTQSTTLGTIRVTPEEKQRIAENAAEASVSLSQWLRIKGMARA